MPIDNPLWFITGERAPRRRESVKKPVAGELAVVTGNVVSLRARPDAGSEQVSQALIGQSVVAEGGQGDWLFVQTWDTYRGWIRADALRRVDDQSSPYAFKGPVAIIRELFVDVFENPTERSPIITKATIASELEISRSDDGWVELNLPDTRKGYIRKHEARLVDKDLAQTVWLPDPRKLVETAARFVGVPYLWGGTSPFGLDCSGFVQLVYRIHNVTLLRDSKLQFSDPRGEETHAHDLRAGDLVFFGDGGSVTHVGMALGPQAFIHACSAEGVTVASLDDPRYADIYIGSRRMRLATLDPGGGVPEQ
ncbi:MAG: hypothetical protein A2Z18_08580 [Armatimonadetes bacterium RBG_16_58_9]|nr:MAG: hypothetical protein A2Z18_08580 [Armatimonadetes bacterium RBG_16_58_9]